NKRQLKNLYDTCGDGQGGAGGILKILACQAGRKERDNFRFERLRTLKYLYKIFILNVLVFRYTRLSSRYDELNVFKQFASYDRTLAVFSRYTVFYVRCQLLTPYNF